MLKNRRIQPPKTNILYSAILAILAMSCLVKVSMAQNYFQQKVDYRIEVRLNDTLHQLTGIVEMDYYNNSQQALDAVFIHLWPNAYSSKQTAFAKQQLENGSLDFHAAKKSKLGAIDSLDFTVDGMPVEVQTLKEFPDVVKLILPKPLPSTSKMVIRTPFRLMIPYSFSRLGHVGQAYQITQWYPKPAVIDNRGPHPMPYLDQGEFYSEYGSFDVKITLPENYIVGATGVLQNQEEVLFLKGKSDSTKKIVSYGDDMQFPASSSKEKTLHYKQDNIHDFAWFADKRFHVIQSEVKLPKSGASVTTYVMFTNLYAEYWKKAYHYVDSALYYYSLWNGDYPYAFCTAVDAALSAGAGMEYPMVTVIGAVSDDKTLDQVIAHEVGHNWFYGILGSNEREYGWLDEGVNSFYENRYMAKRYPKASLLQDQPALSSFLGLDRLPAHYADYLAFQILASNYDLQAIQTHSELFRPLNYATVMYTKTSMMLRHLELYLGTELFDSCMHHYFQVWKFRHPYSEDLQFCMEEIAQQDLSWFFKDVVLSEEQLDFEAEKLDRVGRQIRVTIENKSNVQMPIFVSSIDKQGNVLETLKTSPYRGRIQVYFEPTNVHKVVIDPYYIIPEFNRNNNTLKADGFLKRMEPISLQPLASITKPDRTNLFFSPLFGYNVVDGFQAGLALYNNVFPFKNFEWYVAPMYGFGSNKINGAAQASFRYHVKPFREVLFQYNFYSFGFSKSNVLEPNGASFVNNITVDRFIRNSYKLEFTLKEQYSRSSVKRSFGYKFIDTQHQFTSSVISEYYIPGVQYNFDQLKYHQFFYKYANKKILNPNSFQLMLELGQSNPNTIGAKSKPYQKISGTFLQRLNYPGSKQGVDLRLFSGVIFADNSFDGSLNYFNLSGNIDYAFEKAFFHRFDVNSTQFHVIDGAFKSNTFTEPFRGLLALNLKAALPTRISIGVFADAALASKGLPTNGMVDYYDFGFYVPIVRNVFEIYFPMYTSNYGNLFADGQPSFLSQIRVMFDLPLIQPLNLIRQVSIGI